MTHNETVDFTNLNNNSADASEISSIEEEFEEGNGVSLRQFYKQKWILYPDDVFKQYWNMIICLALLYTASITPIRVVFVTDTSEELDDWDILDFIIDSIFGVDIFISFFSAYYDSEDELVVDSKKIMWTYLCGWFCFDFISIFPFSLIL